MFTKCKKGGRLQTFFLTSIYLLIVKNKNYEKNHYRRVY